MKTSVLADAVDLTMAEIYGTWSNISCMMLAPDFSLIDDGRASDSLWSNLLAYSFFSSCLGYSSLFIRLKKWYVCVH